MKRRIFALVGMPGSGKTEATLILKDSIFSKVVMGDVIREEMKNKKIPINSKNMREFMIDLRKKEGMDIVARKCIRKIESLDSNIIIIDGLRNFEEVEFFKKNLESFKIIAVNTSSETRYKRLLARKREDDSLDIELLKERDKKEISVGIGRVIEIADHIIDNEGTVEQLQKEFKKIIEIDVR